MGLDAGKAVGDGLFLSFLESQRIVQSAGDQVGECSEQQDFFFGEINVCRRFDVKNAMQLFGEKNGQADRGGGIGEHRTQGGVRGQAVAERDQIAGASHIAD